jgi:ATP-binding cassette subfamily B protein
MSATAVPQESFLAQLPHVPRALRLVWHAAPWWTLFWLVGLILQALVPVALVFCTRLVVDRIAAAAGTGASWEVFRQVLLPAALMAALLLFNEILRAADRLMRSMQAELVRDAVSGLIHQRSMAVDLAHFESPDYHDRLYRARSDSHERPVVLVQSLGALLQHALTLAGMAAVLVRFGWWVPLALVISTLPALAVVAGHARRHHRWNLRTTAESRRGWYLDWLLCTRETAAEVRLFDLGRQTARGFQSIRSGLRQARLKLSRTEAGLEILAAAFALAVTGGAMVWITIQALDGRLSIGELAMAFQAFAQGQRLMRSLLESAGQVWSNALFLDNLFAFLAIEPAIADPLEPLSPPAESPPGVRLRGVRFNYPGSDSAVFEGLDLEIPSGSVAALLGVNGAGKTTLVKLLCRFYDPDRGSVELGGVDLRRLRVRDARSLVSALYQEPVHFSETVLRNIVPVDDGRRPNREAVASALAASGAREVVDKLPDGLETRLGTWFEGGAELSVGEWHRLALARALARGAPILLLDEPTASMDSWLESDWRRQLRRLGGDRTVIVITHRLTTASCADVIHIMEDGKIVESGSHEDLVKAGGRYQAAWDGQFD